MNLNTDSGVCVCVCAWACVCVCEVGVVPWVSLSVLYVLSDSYCFCVLRWKLLLGLCGCCGWICTSSLVGPVLSHFH